jgi:hypothetical protein
MGGAAKRKQNQMIDQTWNQGNAGFNKATQRADTMYKPMIDTYSNMMSGGGMDADMRKRYMELAGGGGGYGSGAPDMSGYGEVEGLYRDFTQGGGVEADKVREAMGVFKDQIDNKDIANRMRGGGVFDEYSRTGGMDDSVANNMRARGNSAISSSFGRMRNEMGRANAIQGGGANPAMMARMSREQGRAAGQGAVDTELGIHDRRDAGRKWGAQGMTESEKALQGMRGNAGQAWTQGESGLQDMIQRGKMFGTQGLESAAGARASASRAGWGRDDEMGAIKWLSNFEADNRLGAAGGMNSVLGNRPGEVNMYAGQRSGAIDQRMQNNPQRDWLGTAANLIGAGGSMMSGFGAMRPRK